MVHAPQNIPNMKMKHHTFWHIGNEMLSAFFIIVIIIIRFIVTIFPKIIAIHFFYFFVQFTLSVWFYIWSEQKRIHTHTKHLFDMKTMFRFVSFRLLLSYRTDETLNFIMSDWVNNFRIHFLFKWQKIRRQLHTWDVDFNAIHHCYESLNLNPDFDFSWTFPFSLLFLPTVQIHYVKWQWESNKTKRKKFHFSLRVYDMTIVSGKLASVTWENERVVVWCVWVFIFSFLKSDGDFYFS